MVRCLQKLKKRHKLQNIIEVMVWSASSHAVEKKDCERLLGRHTVDRVGNAYSMEQ